MNVDQLVSLLGSEDLLKFKSETVSKDLLHIPSPNFIDEIYGISDRNPQVLRSIGSLF